jgi:hypothetical protein
MWDRIERGYERLSKKEKERVAREGAPAGKNVRFPGFDGNYESEQLGIATFLTKKLDRYTRFADRALNSHFPTADLYGRMLTAFEGLNEKLVGADPGADDIVALLKAGRDGG